MACVYKITNRINGKIYIGIAKDFNTRMRGHRWSKKRETRIARAIRKYGWENFDKEVIENNIDPTVLESRETYYIDLYNSTNQGVGYNTLRENLYKYRENHPPEVIEKMSNSSKRKYQRNPELGRLQTKGIREKFLPRIVKPVRQINLSTGEIRIWNSMQEAANGLGIDRACISRVARKVLVKNRLGNYHPLASYKGCDWQLLENQENETITTNFLSAK